ncbi:hypothetical protein RI129_007810 [Pyrocoelia pectoralis]|uniref:Ig-like domain-containing protein n=1 Tax=Pyrocoelia pectoralis TaxID=417401 RepID=A0AAN7V8V7_9COLE
MTNITLKFNKGYISVWLRILRFRTIRNSLRLTNMSAPVVADTKQDMELNCRFDMESEELYAIKWYKDDQEFFRYMPHQQPHIMAFPVSGVHLALQNTDCDRIHCKVQLTKLTRHHSDGAYRCEVSSEAPTFRLAAETHNITVATLPKEKPRIQGLEETYNEGDILSANCTSSPSDPAAIVTWFIHNQPAPQKFIEEMRTSDNDGLLFRSVSLRFQVNRKYTQGDSDNIELRCVSTLPGVPFPPQETSYTISLKIHRPQVVSNQKLHWLNSSSVKPFQQYWVVLFLATTTVRW